MYNQFEDQDERNAFLPPEFRNQTKAQIYSTLNNQYLLPAKDSRGVSKRYLARVHSNEVFRVGKIAILQFEATLVPEDVQKHNFLNVSIMVARLNQLLQLLHLPQLGFDAGNYPDEEWVLRIIRYIDGYNILGFYKRAIRNFQRPNILAAEVYVDSDYQCGSQGSC
jgi:hypothetical protein